MISAPLRLAAVLWLHQSHNNLHLTLLRQHPKTSLSRGAAKPLCCRWAGHGGRGRALIFLPITHLGAARYHQQVWSSICHILCPTCSEGLVCVGGKWICGWQFCCLPGVNTVFVFGNIHFIPYTCTTQKPQHYCATTTMFLIFMGLFILVSVNFSLVLLKIQFCKEIGH